MDSNTEIKRIIHRLYKKDILTDEEINQLESWLSKLRTDETFENWLQSNWQASEDQPVEISFEVVRHLIRKRSEKSGRTILINKFQEIAAILLIPLLIASSILIYQKLNVPEKWITLSTARGERSHVTLPDGSDVWLNVDSKLEYSTDYGESNRTLKLTGEAFFKVAKHQKRPFLVQAKDFQVKAVGTEFGVFAYDNEQVAETFLKEGIVDVKILNREDAEIRLQPGQKSIIKNNSSKITVKKTTLESDAAWTSGHLVFQNEEMPVVFRKIERWYNVSIHFKEDEFSAETLYVNLKSGETLEKMLEIIDNAIGISVKRNGNEINIEKKIKRANS